MATRWDMVVRDRNDRPVLAVEVKRKLDASPQWAAEYRRNLLAHGIAPEAPYLLMAFPDQLYLWNNNDSDPGETQPTLAIDALPIFGPYYERAGVSADRLSETSLEIIAETWLNTVLFREPDHLDTSERWLVDSGVYDALVGGKIEYEVAA